MLFTWTRLSKIVMFSSVSKSEATYFCTGFTSKPTVIPRTVKKLRLNVGIEVREAHSKSVVIYVVCLFPTVVSDVSIAIFDVAVKRSENIIKPPEKYYFDKLTPKMLKEYRIFEPVL